MITISFAAATSARVFANWVMASFRDVVCKSIGSFHREPVAITYGQSIQIDYGERDSQREFQSRSWDLAKPGQLNAP
jgi:hypothetical protein